MRDLSSSIARFFCLALSASLVGLTPDASADTVYTQPALWTGDGTSIGSSWTSHIDDTLSGFRAFDNFSVASTTTINQATWFGVYLNNDPDLTNGVPNTSTWVIPFYSDNAGVPQSVLSATIISAAQVLTQTVGTGVINDHPVTVYEFTAPLVAFQADAGVTYWFSPLSRAPAFSPLFSWIEGTGGDGSTFQSLSQAGVVTDTFTREGDRAFTLSNVPEPATIFLMAAALAGLVFTRRRLYK